MSARHCRHLSHFWPILLGLVLLVVPAAAKKAAGPAAAGFINGSSTPTFIDTLNYEREIGLSEHDAGGEGSSSVQPNESPDSFTGFRIQCFASSIVESVRAEKKNIASKFEYPARVVYTSPYYKLMIGDFTRRSEADSALVRVRSTGYGDAWIVTGTGFPTR